MQLLLVEDDGELVEFMGRVLEEEGHVFVAASTLNDARTFLSRQFFDAVVLDWMLPDGDGILLCEELSKRAAPVPVLMLTARGDLADRVKGLRSGADDYLVKPFEIEELLARLDAITRRSKGSGEQRFGVLLISRLTHQASVDGVNLDLRIKEFSLLARLAAASDEAVDRATLLADVWNLKFDPGSGLLDVHISRLRDKLGAEAWRVETVRGVGYRFRSDR